MRAAALLTELRQAGLTLQADGDRLVVAPRDRLTDEIRATIRTRKPDLLAVLAATQANGPGPDWVERAAIIQHDGGYSPANAERHAREGWIADDWRRWIGELTARYSRTDTEAGALSRAYGAALIEHHVRHGARAAPGRCAGCGQGIDGSAVLALPDGAAVHGDGLGCLTAYGSRWRVDAVAGLKRLGVEPPMGWMP